MDVFPLLFGEAQQLGSITLRGFEVTPLLVLDERGHDELTLAPVLGVPAVLGVAEHGGGFLGLSVQVAPLGVVGAEGVPGSGFVRRRHGEGFGLWFRVVVRFSCLLFQVDLIQDCETMVYKITQKNSVLGLQQSYHERQQQDRKGYFNRVRILDGISKNNQQEFRHGPSLWKYSS